MGCLWYPFYDVSYSKVTKQFYMVLKLLHSDKICEPNINF